MSFKLYGDKIKKDFRKSLFINYPIINRELGFCYALSGVPIEIQQSIKNKGKKNILIFNNSVIKDILNITTTNLYSETIYFESIHAKYMKQLKYEKDYLKNAISDYSLPSIADSITFGTKANLIIVDNIGGWYMNKKNYLDYLSKSISLLKTKSSLPIEIRLHPKNRKDKNIHKTINSKFKNIKMNESNIETNLPNINFYVTNNSHLAYYYFYNGCKVLTLSDKALYYHTGFQHDNKNYINNIHKLFNMVFHHTIFFNGTENKQLENLITQYIK